MEADLTHLEKEIAYMLAQGMRAVDVCVNVGISYLDYIKYRNIILKKLKIRRITQILQALNSE